MWQRPLASNRRPCRPRFRVGSPFRCEPGYAVEPTAHYREPARMRLRYCWHSLHRAGSQNGSIPGVGEIRQTTHGLQRYFFKLGGPTFAVRDHHSKAMDVRIIGNTPLHAGLFLSRAAPAAVCHPVVNAAVPSAKRTPDGDNKGVEAANTLEQPLRLNSIAWTHKNCRHWPRPTA